MNSYNYYDQFDESYNSKDELDYVPLSVFIDEDIERPYKNRYDNEKEAIEEILKQLIDNPYDLDKHQLHGDLMFLCIQKGIRINEYDDVELLSVDHYKEKYKYTNKGMKNESISN